MFPILGSANLIILTPIQWHPTIFKMKTIGTPSHILLTSSFLSLSQGHWSSSRLSD